MVRRVAGDVKIYVRRFLADDWIERTDLRLASLVQQGAGKVTPIVLTEDDLVPDQPLYKWWCRITYTPDGADENEQEMWIGNIEDARRRESDQVTQWLGSSLEAQLRRIRMDHSYAEYDPTLGTDFAAGPVDRLQFNERMDAEGNVADGLCSTELYHFAEDKDVQVGVPEADDARTDDLAPVFGNDAVWTNLGLLKHLMRVYVPPGGRERGPLVGFVLGCTTAAEAYLDGYSAEYDLTGKNVLAAIQKVIEDAGPLFWWLNTADWVKGLAAYPTLKVASRLYDDEEPNGELDFHALAKPDFLASTVRYRVKDRATKVIARGAPLKVQFSVAFGLTPSGEVPGLCYELGWLDSKEADYRLASDEERKSPELDRVFLYYRFPHDQVVDLVDFVYPTWTYVVVRPDLTASPAGSEYARFDSIERGGIYARPRPLLNRNLTYQGWTNPTANGDPLPTPPAGGVLDRPERDPLLCWWVPNTTLKDAGYAPHHIEQVVPLKNEAGIKITEKAVRDSQAPFLMEDEVAEHWKHLIFTVSCELDQCLKAEATWDQEGWVRTEDDQRRIEVIEMPECQWWAAVRNAERAGLDCVMGVDEDGNFETIQGVLRNDYAVLQAAAEQRLKILDQADLLGTIFPAVHGRFPCKFVETDYRVGDFVTSYGDISVQSPIASVEYELRDPETWGTTLTTFKPYSMEDMP